MAFLFYVRLIALTAGTLVYLFLIALILGHRRPRLFERLLFFLALALLAIYGGGLLQINATIQYGTPPEATALLSDFLATLGLLALCPLIWHAHVEYVRTIQEKRISGVALGQCRLHVRARSGGNRGRCRRFLPIASGNCFGTAEFCGHGRDRKPPALLGVRCANSVAHQSARN